MAPHRVSTNSVRGNDLHVSTYVHLAHLPRADEALTRLKKIASAVKPIMRNHKWKVRELAEFYPDDQNLLGLNVNRGRQICLRLRHAGDKTQFLPPEMVLDTMLHELCHIVHGPHNKSFHDLWEKLRDEHMALTTSGYTGESFLSDGRRLGGAVPQRELGRLSRQQPLGGRPVAVAGRRLGGRAPASRQDMRNAAAAAAERRRRALEGCGAERLDEVQIISIGETVSQNGFRTKAEEDKANDIAIAQALAELMEMDDGRAQAQAASLPAVSSSSTLPPRGGGPVRRIPSNDKQPAGQSRLIKQDENKPGWVCSACTLYNPANYLCCDACGAEKGRSDIKSKVSQQKESTVIDLT